MSKIKKQENTINIKSSWNDITIKDFIQIQQIKNLDIDEISKEFEILSLLSGKTIQEIENLDILEWKKLRQSFNFLFTEIPKTDKFPDTLNINGVSYKVIKKIEELKAGQGIDLINYTKDNTKIISNLHKICSVVLLPINKRKVVEKYGQTDFNITQKNLYENMKITDALSIGFFFTTLYHCLLEITKDYLNQEIPKNLKLASKILKQKKIPITKEMKLVLKKNGDGLLL